ncbi:TRAP transporter small permease subunit [Pseudosulfitobacter pseudonitzschiae]|uniref:TRAP transporter small permease subunit n=1 Tax=Pseudosulfitobacter pseudonitzschiae TaxID=1402135 RepID=UPI001AF17FCA|nr:TRAP transporter small permease [Pseudosulfitobacter pseudonitzschiae]MBM1816773.1 TRAP transporter small permease [Pseudosulfitobacter pseudonitzschiae]MBM1833584.1 TRAP transporter small permease [Pseudosulfitobacter pseudonitzschiae]MBM1838450.1 TRAP transporter small permease [Pseudosulfitobacter pseudonitzschiae]MBM1843500.1 TRAP transporter small permease [Pseudosulfitobacter pseudonitzschiae]MBM1848366.1 TRAP transporter small permease [Pseudosulfitobacter pseudonitzschiae]
MAHLIRFDLLLTRIAAAIAAVAVILMMLTVASDAFSRQVFNARIPFVSVIVANYFMVAIAFLPLAMAEAQDRNISVDLVYGNLGPGAQRLVGLLVHVLAFATCCGLTSTMWDEAMRRYASGSVAVEDGVSMAVWQGYFLLPAGFALLAMTYLLRIVLGLVGAREARAPLIPDVSEIAGEGGQ